MRHSILFSLIVLLGLFALCPVAYAQYAGDCGLARFANQQSFVQELAAPYSDYLNSDDVQLAFEHLRSYCCQQKIVPSWTFNCTSVSDQYAQSPFLLDHLVGIGFRKQDWDRALIYPGLQPDQQGAARRTIAQQLAAGDQGVMPLEFLARFEQSRWVADGIDYPADREACEALSPLSAGAGLAQRYYVMCGVAHCIAGDDRLAVQNPDSSSREGYELCIQEAASRIGDEYQYVQSLILKKSAQLLKDSLHSYLHSYFITNRFQLVLEKIGALEEYLGAVVSKVAEGTKSCNL